MFQLIRYALPKFANPLCGYFNKSVYSIAIKFESAVHAKKNCTFWDERGVRNRS